MTKTIDTHLTDPTIIGPYSPWPRPTRKRRAVALIAGSVAGLGVFIHCVVPLLMLG